MITIMMIIIIITIIIIIITGLQAKGGKGWPKQFVFFTDTGSVF